MRSVRARWWLVLLGGSAVVASCTPSTGHHTQREASRPAIDPARADEPRQAQPKRFVEHVRVDPAAGLVEFDAVVVLNFMDPVTPDTWLEQLVCTRDTKAHESLVVMRALPSQVHAAMLLAGFVSGSPGRWTWDGDSLTTHPPTGSALTITMVWHDADGQLREVPISDWVINAETGRTLTDMARADGGHFVFGGSIISSRPGISRYAADAAGTMVGLTSFGTETISWSTVWSPEETIDEPQWLARNEAIPPMGTRVVVRVWKAQRDVDQADR